MPELATFGETMLRFSAPPGERLETAGEFNVVAGGAESNVAITASNLGTDAAWLSKLPRSPLGRRVERDLLANGVAPAVAWEADPTSRLGTYYLEPGEQPRDSTVIYDRRGSAVTSTRPADLDVEVLRDAAYFCTSGITPALSEILFDTTAELLDLARTEGVRTVVDLNYREQLWSAAEAREAFESLLPGVDVICAAERDARTVLDLAGDPETMAADLRTAFDADVVVLTCGPDGAVAVDGRGTYEQPAYPTETVDAVGSGDAFLGAFLASRIEGKGIEESLDIGAAAAAICRTTVGDWSVVSHDEIDRIRRKFSFDNCG